VEVAVQAVHGEEQGKLSVGRKGADVEVVPDVLGDPDRDASVADVADRPGTRIERSLDGGTRAAPRSRRYTFSTERSEKMLAAISSASVSKSPAVSAVSATRTAGPFKFRPDCSKATILSTMMAGPAVPHLDADVRKPVQQLHGAARVASEPVYVEDHERREAAVLGGPPHRAEACARLEQRAADPSST
jgi:hypothetical protein